MSKQKDKVNRKTLFLGVLTIITLAIVVIVTFSLINQAVSTPSYVSWDNAIITLNSGKVSYVIQTHSLDVRLGLKDGGIIKTREPKIDDILREIEKCGDLCKDIQVILE